MREHDTDCRTPGCSRPQVPTWHLDEVALTISARTEEQQERAAAMLLDHLRLLGQGTPSAQHPLVPVAARHGYKRAVQSVAYPGARVSWAGTPEQGVHLRLSGQPLAALRRHYAEGGEPRWAHVHALLELLERVGHEWHATRVDVACDNDRIPPGALEYHRERDELVTRSRNLARVEGANTGALTETLGSRTSSLYVRVYDKAGERARGDEGLYWHMAPWYRLECEFHDEAAQTVLEMVRNHGGAGARACVASRLDFRAWRPDTNVARWERQPWWSELLDTGGLDTPTVPHSTRDLQLDARLAWLAGVGAGILADAARERGLDWVDGWALETVMRGHARRGLRATETSEGGAPESA